MALPTDYSDATLKAFMHDTLAGVADVLGFSVANGDYDEPLISTLFAIDVDDVTTITSRADLLKLRKLAAREAWRAAQAEAASRYHFNADGGQYSRQQVFDMIGPNLERAEREASPYDAYSPLRVGRTTVTYDDPYSARLDESGEAAS